MISTNERAKTYIEKGKHKTTHKRSKIFVLAILGGIFSAFGCIGYAFGYYFGGETGQVTGALIFPVGIILTTMAGAELFTGNCLLSMPLLSGHVKLWRVIRNLLVVYIGNLIGSVLIAFLTTSSGVLELISTTVVDTAVMKATLNPMQAFIRGLLCNMLITLGVWGAEASKGAPGKILSVYLPIVVFVLAGFEIKDAREQPYMDWYVLRAEAIETTPDQNLTDMVRIGLKQLNLPRMEEEPMMLVVISQNLEPQK
jgi:formate/nitrite transporter FocA (FNT family)